MAKYKKRADGRYHTTVSTGKFDKKTGKPITAEIYGRTLSEMETKLSEVRLSLETGTYFGDVDLTIKTYANKWLNVYKKSKAHNTYKNYTNIIKNHFGIIEDLNLRDLTKMNVQESINRLNGHWDLQHMLKITINQILESAIDDDLLDKNVSRNVVLPPKPKSNTRAFSEFEKKVILEAPLTLKESVFVNILYYTGIRREELLALSKSDINLELKKITIRYAIVFKNNRGVLSPLKTPSAYRTLDILSPLEPILRAYLDSCDTEYLFTSSNGSNITQTAYKRLWSTIHKKINEHAGGKHHWEKGKSESSSYKLIIDLDLIKDVTPHMFRHNFATMLYYSDVDLKEAVSIMGHSDSKIMIELYTHLDKFRSNSLSKLEKMIADDMESNKKDL